MSESRPREVIDHLDAPPPAEVWLTGLYQTMLTSAKGE